MDAENERRPGNRPRTAIQALNFFVADAQAGIGPFLGVFLQARGWTTGAIGTVMTIGGIAGMIVTAPAGALVDATTHKRRYIIVSAICTIMASALIWVSQGFWVIAGSQVATAIAGTAIGPGMAGLTLGIFRQQGFNRQNGRNQAFNHAGNMVGAALSGLLGWIFGFVAVFWLAAAFAVLAIVSTWLIPKKSIDDRVARGLEDEPGNDEKAKGFEVLLECKPLLILAAALALFHLGNGAMLPLYGLAVVAAHEGNPAAFVATTIVVAQGVMILASLVAMRMAEKRGYWLVILITFLVLPIRGLVAASVITISIKWGLSPTSRLRCPSSIATATTTPAQTLIHLNSGYQRLLIAPGIALQLKQWRLYTDIELPIYQHTNAAASPAIEGTAGQLVAPALYKVELAYDF